MKGERAVGGSNARRWQLCVQPARALTCSATALNRHEPSLAIGFLQSFLSDKNLSREP